MMKLTKSAAAVFAVFLMISVFLPCLAAEPAEVVDKGIISVAHFGDRFTSPVGSAKNITACAEMGVDMVCLPVVRSSDGELLILSNEELALCCADENGNALSGLAGEAPADVLLASFLLNADFSVSESHPVTLAEALTLIGDCKLILDSAWEFRDEVWAVAETEGKTDRLLLRTDAPADEIISWTSSKNGQPQVIGVYSGNIVFMATSKSDKLINGGMDYVQLASGNFFASIFDRLTLSRFRKDYTSRAFVSTYDKALCGQREDSREGWDDLTARGYSVIETENPRLLVDYVNDITSARQTLAELCGYAEKIDRTGFSPVSSLALSQALNSASAEVGDPLCSLSELEKATTTLHSALDALVPGHSKDTQRNSFNVTPGKVIAVILGGAGVVAAQIFARKRQKPLKASAGKHKDK